MYMVRLVVRGEKASWVFGGVSFMDFALYVGLNSCLYRVMVRAFVARSETRSKAHSEVSI